jgi:hypothetical protein
MLHGNLDVLVSAGYFEGWAYDDQALAEPILVSVVDGDDLEVASGLAHLYRPDLVTAKCGLGWCHFRLKTEEPVSKLRKSSFRLLERTSGQTLCSLDRITYLEASDISFHSVEAVSESDPTIVRFIDELSGCEALLDKFIKTRGVDAFVRTAYVYVLGRPADAEGLALYGKLIRRTSISPFTMMQTLASSTEFHSRPRSLVAPNMVGFPFVCN